MYSYIVIIIANKSDSPVKKNLSIIAILFFIFSFVTPALAATFNPKWEDLGSGQIRGNAVNQNTNVEGMASTSNPITGAITKVLIDPGNNDIIYAGAVNGGIWKSTDGGNTWNPKTDRLSSLSIGAMNFDPASSQIIIAGVGRQSAFGYSSGPLTGIQYSTDGGEKWKELGRAALNNKDITGVAARGDVMMATVRDIYSPIATVGLYRSIDGGTNFSNLAAVVIGLPGGNIQNLVGDPSKATRFYLSVVNGNDAQTGIYMSDDTGASWLKIKAVTGLSTTESTGRILLSVGTDGVLAAQVQQGTNRLDILRSSNQGSSWTTLGGISQGQPSTPDFTGIFPGGQSNPHGAIMVDPKNSNIVYVAGDTQFTTNNLETPNSIGATEYSCPIFRGVYDPVTGVTTWTYITNNNTLSGSAPHADARTFAMDSNGRLLFGCDGGLFAYSGPSTIKTTNWIPLMENLRTTEMTQSYWNSITHTISAAAQDLGAFYQFPDQKGTYDWSSTSGGDGGPCPVNAVTFKASNISVVYASSQQLGGFRRFKVGPEDDAQQALTTRTALFPKLGGVSIAGNKTYMSFLPIVALNRDDPRKMAIGGKQIFIGTDDQTVDTVNGYSFPVTSILTPANDISSLTYGTNSTGANVKSNALLAGTENTVAGDYLYYTANATTTPMTTLSAYALAGGKYVWKAIFDERDGDRFYVADGTDIWRSTDAGATVWAKINGDLPVNFVDRRGLAFAANNGVNALFAGGVSNDTSISSGLYVTRFTASVGAETTPSWSAFGGSLANAPVYGLSYDNTDDVLLVNLLGRGAWVVYDLTTYFPEATTLIFGNANNDSAPDASILINGTTVGGAGFDRGLTKNGTGTLTINSASTYKGSTIINGGTLQVGDPHALGTGAVTNNATGTLDLGTTDLILAAGKTYIQNAGSTLKLTANSSSSFGSITSDVAVTTAADSAVTVTVGGYIPTNATLTIIDTGGAGIAGDIVPDTINSTNSFVGFSVESFDNNLVLTATRSGANSFSGAASNSNGAAVGGALDSITNPSPDMLTILNALTLSTPSEVAASEDSMTPTDDGAVTQVSTAMLNNFINNMESHLQNFRTTGGTTGIATGDDYINGVDIWAQGLGDYAHQGPRGSSNGYNATSWGISGGADKDLFNDSIRAGLGSGYGQTFVRSKDFSGRTDINSIPATIYCDYENNNLPFYIDAVFTFVYNLYTGSRQVTAGPTITRTASADYEGQQYSGYLEGGYSFFYKKLSLTPLASFQYMHLHTGSYTETGASALNLSVASQDYDMAQTGLGAKLACPFEQKCGTFTPDIHFKWLYDWVGDRQATTAGFAGGGTSFGTNGFAPAQSAYDFGARFDFKTKYNVTIGLDYDFLFKADYYEHYGTLNVKCSF